MTLEGEAHEELLNVYDDEGRVVGAQPRAAAKASGRAVGAVNALVVNGKGEVLLQRRPRGKENAERWDKSVGGHVGAGESFDETIVREAGEELFDDPCSTRIRLAADADAFRGLVTTGEPRNAVVLYRVSLQKRLRDVRVGPDGSVRNVLYHVAIYLGRTDLEIGAFRPQASEILALAYHPFGVVDRMLLDATLAPNMAFLWLAHARELAGLV